MAPAWFGKIYNKLETILVEVDTFTSQSTLCLNPSDDDPSGWESVRGEPDESAEDPSSDLQQHYDRLALRSCDSPSDPPSHQNFDVSGEVGVEEQVEEDIMKEDLSVSSSSSSSGGETLSGASLIQEYCAGNLTLATTRGDEESLISNTLTSQKFSAGEALVFTREESVEEVRVESFTESQSTQSSVESSGSIVECKDDPATLGISRDDSNLNPTNTKLLDAHVEDNVAANLRSSNEDDPVDVLHGKLDVSKEMSSMPFREDPSYGDDNDLYALHARTKKLRSVKRKILDALTTKRIREKEYEQLAIWFGDANMGSDLVKEVSKSSKVHESEDSQWELL